MIEEMNQEEISKYIVDHSDEFLVGVVEPNLISLVLSETFEKCFVKASKNLLGSDIVTNFQTAAINLSEAGFDLQHHPASGIFGIRTNIKTSVPLPIWMRFLRKS
jgi:hypothetical protein